MKALLEVVQYIFEELLFLPFNFLKELELSSWFGANILNWGFMFIGMAAFAYWMKQLKSFNDNKEENRKVVSHSFLAENVQE